MLNSRTLIHFLLITALMLLTTNCKKKSENQTYSFEEYFSLGINNNNFFAQIAVSPEELSQGLMFRNNLDKNHGMLFAFEHPQRVSFWMKNVPIPLDIGYFDSNGRLTEIYSLFPNDASLVLSKSDNIQYALEMNKGWFRGNNIKTGDYLDLDEIIRYISLRENYNNLAD